MVEPTGTVDRINEEFLYEVMSYLSFEQYPADTMRAQARDTRIMQTVYIESVGTNSIHTIYSHNLLDRCPNGT